MENIPKQNDLQLDQTSNNNDLNETTQTADTFSQYYDDYAEKVVVPLAKTDEAYTPFLKKYLREDIIKYLALLIQANYEQIRIRQTKDNIQLISPRYIHQRLLLHITINDAFIRCPQYLIIPYNPREEQFTNVKTALNNLFSKPKSKLTIEEKILRELFDSTAGLEGPVEFTSPLSALIDEYKGEIISVVDQSTATLIRFLEPVATQLNKELSYLKAKHIKGPQLEKLVSLVREFSELYKNKQQETQKLLKILAKAKNHKEALQEFVNFTNITHLGEKEYKQFLLCYIGNNLVTYLALLLQARYDLLQFPKGITIDQSLNFTKIHEMLFDEYPEQLNKLSDKNGPITQAVSTILRLCAYYATNNSKYLKNAAYIILCLFGSPTSEDNYNTKITQLKNALEHYISHEQPEPGAPRNTILSLFGEIATQLQQEAAEAFDNSAKAGQLDEIAKLLSNFIEKYNKKLNQQEQNQNALNNSTQNFIAQLLWDRPDEENTDNNIYNNQGGTETNIYDEGHWEDIDLDNPDEQSHSEESPHSDKDNEGSAKDLNTDTNNEHNPQTNNTKTDGNETNQLKEEEEMKRQAKEQGSQISTTQKIINNLSATNKMLQIIMQILY